MNNTITRISSSDFSKEEQGLPPEKTLKDYQKILKDKGVDSIIKSRILSAELKKEKPEKDYLLLEIIDMDTYFDTKIHRRNKIDSKGLTPEDAVELFSLFKEEFPD